MLVIFASGMVAYGTHEVEEFVVKGDHLEVLVYTINQTYQGFGIY
jgi:hypothetical protein